MVLDCMFLQNTIGKALIVYIFILNKEYAQGTSSTPGITRTIDYVAMLGLEF